jgi:hypothetical protein
MMQKCSIESINNNMHYIGLIILIFIVIITILYFIKITKDSSNNNEIIEKYNTNNQSKVSAEYLNTNGALPLNQDSDSHKVVRSPTLNLIKTSTATFRPCQIHFNNDGTSKYVYEDGWQEFNTLTSQEDNSVYNVPFKKFANNNNNVREFENFNETTKCFKQKNRNISLNTYKYKSNDLIKYKPDSYVAIQFKNDENVVTTDLFMQMLFDKQSADTSLNKYKDSSLDSICSYNYKRDLSLGNYNLYRLTIVPVSNNQNIPINSNSIKDGIITSIDCVTIANEDNSEFRTRDKQFTDSKLPELLSSTNSPFYLIQNGNITYRIVKNELTQEQINNGINVRIYKFNRNLDCSDDKVIKSYETSSLRLKSDILISVAPYISDIINPRNSTMPSDIIISQNEIDKIKEDNATINGIINEMGTDLITKCFNIIMKHKYETKDELLEYIYNFSRKLVAISNRSLVSEVIDLMNKNKENTGLKKIFLDRFDTIQKFIPLYQGNTITAPLQVQLLNDLGTDISIANDQIAFHNYTNIQQIITDVQPFTLENIYEIKIYTIDTADTTLTFEKDTICDILIVGGGGGGGQNSGGGGGAGGLVLLEKFRVPQGNIKIIVGKGGNGGTTMNVCTVASKGDNSSISINGGQPIIAYGGGGGFNSGGYDSINNNGSDGGSGGGAAASSHDCTGHRVGGKGIINQGNNGGNGVFPGGWERVGAGGGGAGGNGNTPTSQDRGGDGGIGKNMSNLFGTNVGDNGWFAGGGGGSSHYGANNGIGGKGGGGNATDTTIRSEAKFSTGGGGGASRGHHIVGGQGGSGIVIVKYLKIPQVVSTTKRELVINTTNNLSPGLYFKVIDGYYNDNLNHTLSNGKPINSNRGGGGGSGIVNVFEGINTATNNLIPPNTYGWEYYTVEWQGYFYAKISGNYTFGIGSDDASHMWLEDGALNYDGGKLLINNGGPHGFSEKSATKYLTQGKYYPIRMLMGEQGGHDNFQFWFIVPGETNRIYNGGNNGWLFHNPNNKEIMYNGDINLQDSIPKIFMRDRDTQVTLNDNNIVTLQKNKSYYIQPYSLNKDMNALVEYSQIYNINESNYKWELTNPNSANQKHVVTFPKNSLCHVVIVAGGGSGGENGGCEGGGGGGGGGIVYATIIFRKNVEYIIEVGNGGIATGGGTGVSGNNSLIYDREKRFLNIVAYGGGAGGMFNGLDGGSGGGGSGHGGHKPGGNVLNRNANDAFGVINFMSYGNIGGWGYHAGSYGAGGGGGGAGKIGNSWASESKSFSSLGSNNYNGSDGGDGISLNSIGEFKDLRNAANIFLGGGGGGASGMNCHGDWRTVMGNSGGLGGIGGGGRGGNRNNPQPGAMGLGGGGGGSSHTIPARGGAGVIYIYRKIDFNTIMEIPTHQLKISYDIEDDTPINLNNARNNKELVNQEPIIKIPYDKNRNNYTYMLGTKTEAYFKCRITLTSLSASFNPTFATKSGNTFVFIPNTSYDLDIKDTTQNDIVSRVIEVLFHNNRNVSGDIYMILQGYANIFRIQGIIDINSLPSFYNNKLSRFLLQKETTINKLFELDDYDNKVQQKINNRLRIFIDNNNLMNYTGTRDDEACRKLPALKEIYNAVYLYNSKEASIKPTITFNNDKKILDIIDGFNINHVSYENPKNKQAVNMESYYHPQLISNNYVYFKYPE